MLHISFPYLQYLLLSSIKNWNRQKNYHMIFLLFQVYCLDDKILFLHYVFWPHLLHRSPLLWWFLSSSQYLICDFLSHFLYKEGERIDNFFSISSFCLFSVLLRELFRFLLYVFLFFPSILFLIITNVMRKVHVIIADTSDSVYLLFSFVCMQKFTAQLLSLQPHINVT